MGDTDVDQEPTGIPPVTWAPDACTLPTPDRPLREAEFDTLFATALRGIERRTPTWLRLHLDAAAEAGTRELTARESSCCAFFDFRLTAGHAGLTLDVRVPPAQAAVLDGIACRAGAARGGATG